MWPFFSKRKTQKLIVRKHVSKYGRVLSLLFWKWSRVQKKMESLSFQISNFSGFYLEVKLIFFGDFWNFSSKLASI